MKVLVIGSGHNVKAELAMIDRDGFDKVIGVNRAAELFGPVDIHISLHPDKFAKNKQAHFVSFTQMPGVDEVLDYVWPDTKGKSGSSGLYAVKYAIERLQADLVVLAGVGMDTAPHVYNNCNWKQAEILRTTWAEVRSRLIGKVVSLGGYTAELLGKYNPVADNDDLLSSRNVAAQTQ